MPRKGRAARCRRGGRASSSRPRTRAPPPAPAAARPGGSRHRKQRPAGPGCRASRRWRPCSSLVVAAFGVGFTDGFGSEASRRADRAGVPARLAAGPVRAGGRAHRRRRRPGHRPARSRLHRPRRDQRVLRAEVASPSTATPRWPRSRPPWTWRRPGSSGPTPDVPADLARRPVDRSLGARRVINPQLGGGRPARGRDRLRRSGPQIADMNGQPLVTKSADYRIGVYPGQLDRRRRRPRPSSARSPGSTSSRCSARSRPRRRATSSRCSRLSPAGFRRAVAEAVQGARPRLRSGRRSGCSTRPRRRWSARSAPRTPPVLRDEGAAYQPGMTVGLTGLEQTYQDELIGTPTTSVVVVNAAGATVATLWNSPAATRARPLQTTLSSTDQQAAAVTALARAVELRRDRRGRHRQRGDPGPRVRMQAGSVPLPDGGSTLTAKVEPGMAFSIVSAAALLSSRRRREPPAAVRAGGRRRRGDVHATSQPRRAPRRSPPTSPTGCGTAFANMSRTLTAQQLTSGERGFGIGVAVAAAGAGVLRIGPGRVRRGGGGGAGDRAGGVLMSPLGMATVAAEVASGSPGTPCSSPATRRPPRQAPLSATQPERAAAADAARRHVRGRRTPADLSGAPVYGQAGVVKTGAELLPQLVRRLPGRAWRSRCSRPAPRASQAAAALAGRLPEDGRLRSADARSHRQQRWRTGWRRRPHVAH